MKNRLLPACIALAFYLIPIFVHAQTDPVPEVNIVGPTVVCQGDCATLGALFMNVPQPIGYIWSGPNGFTSNQPQITVCPQANSGGPTTTANMYFLQIVGPNGNVVAADTHEIKILPFIPIKILSNNTAPCNFDSTVFSQNHCELNCPNSTVTYSIENIGQAGTQSFISWQVSGASSYTINNPPFNSSVTVTWGSAGTGFVSVVSDGISNCSGEDALCITIIPEPVAKFTTTPSNGVPLVVCKGQTVYFENQSTGADSYDWYFSDDLSSTNATNPEHTFQNPGLYLVTLIARSSCLCADTTTLEVYVIDAVTPALDCIGTICPGATVTYTASNGCAPFNWVVSPNGTVLGGGQNNSDTIQVSWNSGPLGQITLSAQPCSGTACPTPTVFQVPIISDNAEISGPERVCPGSTETYSIEPYGGTGFVWTISGAGTILDGQGTNRITVEWNTFPNPNVTNWIQVQYDNCYLGCGGQDSIGVLIVSPFSIDGPVELCAGANGNFNTFLSATNQPIQANWSLTGPNGAVIWSTGAAAANVAAPFVAGSGIYQMVATPANPNETCTDAARWTVVASALPSKPTSITGAKNICPGTTYNYKAEGLPNDNNVVWTVQNGPGAPSTIQGNPINVNWAANGPRWLSAAAVSTNGLNCSSDTLRLDISVINTLPITGDPQVCINTLSDYSILPLQNVDIQWSISPSSAAAIADGQGTEQLRLFWTEAGGHVISVSVCGQTSQYPVTVLASPLPNVLSPAGLCVGASAVVQTSNSFVDYQWSDVNGVVLSTLATPSMQAGSYSLQVTDSNGCVGTTEFTIDQRPQPNLTISTADPTGFCNNSNFITLTALGSIDVDYTYQWFQDGNPVGTNSPTHVTNQYGNYTATVSNFFGCSATAGPISLFNYCGPGGGGYGFPANGGACPPNSVDIGILPTAKCDSFQFNLINNGLYVAGTANWLFGQSGALLSGTSNQDNPSFYFNNAGKYLAILTVQLTNGSTCFVIDSVDVLLHAQFDPIMDCPGANSGFKDVSTLLPGAAVTTWGWDFGDPVSGPNNTSFLQDPSHNFIAGGFFLVTLTITEVSGCISQQTQMVEVPAPAPLNYSPPAATCAGNALEFTAIGTPDITMITWDFGDPASGGANTATGIPVYHNYSPAGTYTVTAFSTNTYGCTASFVKNIVVQPNPLTGTITPNAPAPLCEGTTQTLTAPAGAVAYLWTDGSTTQSITVSEAGSYRVTLTDANGCTYATPAVDVNITPAPDALIKAFLENELGQVIGTSYPTLSTCAGEDVHLVAVGNGAYNYTWSGGNGTGADLFFSAFRGNLLTVGTHIYTVTITDVVGGCTAVSDPFVVDVHPVPSGFSISTSGICANNPNTLTYAGPTPANWQLIWSNGEAGPTLSTTGSGAYYIRVVNEFGCEGRSNTVSILPGPPVSSIPGGCHTRCAPDTICLPLLPNITSWQWYLNGSPIPGATTPNFVAQQSGTYWAVLSDIFGCSGQSDPLTLQLFQGTGDINGQVWSDVNDNGIIDAADTLITGIPVQLLSSGGTVLNTLNSDINGAVAFSNIPSTNYSIYIDPAALTSNWAVVIGTQPLGITGCDNVASGDLLVKFVCTPSTASVNLMACPGEFANYNGTPVATGTSQVFTLTNAFGCDSLVTVSVGALPVTDTTLNVKICPGATYNYAGTTLPVGATQIFTLVNFKGCDSLVTVNVGALATSSSTLNVKVCNGATYNYFGSQLGVGQSANFTFSNYLGCDSTVTINVSAYALVTGSLNVSICPNDTFTYFGTPMLVGDVAAFTLSSVITGCDSVVTVTVGPLPTFTSTFEAQVCPRTSFNYQGEDLAIGTTKDFTLSSVITGCDSTVTVSVSALPEFTSAFVQKVCPGETFTYENSTLVAGDIQSFTLVSTGNGCDSVVTVTVLEKPIAQDTLLFTVCPGTAFDYNGTKLQPGTTQTFKYAGFEGCDSTVTVSVSAYPDAIFTLGSAPSCLNTPTGQLDVLNAAGGLTPYLYSLDGTVFQDSTNFELLTPGNYTVYLQDGNDCLFERDTLIASIPALTVNLQDAILPCDTSGVRLTPIVGAGQNNLSYQWWNGAITENTTAVEPGIVWVEVRNVCETQRAEASANWADFEFDASYVYVPNVFSPNASRAENATFHPFFPIGVELTDYRFEVFDRWGNMMFHSEQINEGWNGNFKSKDFKPGVCGWYLVAKIAYCGQVFEIKKKGDVTLVN